MHYRWLMSLLAVAVLATTPELRLAHQLEREAQFLRRMGRPHLAQEKIIIATWLKGEKGKSHDRR